MVSYIFYYFCFVKCEFYIRFIDRKNIVEKNDADFDALMGIIFIDYSSFSSK